MRFCDTKNMKLYFFYFNHMVQSLSVTATLIKQDLKTRHWMNEGHLEKVERGGNYISEKWKSLPYDD